MSSRAENPREDPLSPASGHELEHLLGDPREPGNPLSHARAVALDEAEAYPLEECALLWQHGYLAPATWSHWASGRGSFEMLLERCRVVSRRDLATAITLGQSFLGALPVLLAGSDVQRQHLDSVIAAGAGGCLALTERDHGSDLAATDLRARGGSGNLHLSGAKWCINNAARCRTVTLLCRTEGTPGETGGRLAVVFLDKEQLPRGRWSLLPRLRTHGIRSAEFSGVRFDDCAIPPEAVVDRAAALPLVMKTLQISRALCSGLSLGAGDTALRVTLDFAVERHLYGKGLVEIGAARAELRRAFVALLIADCVARLAHRALAEQPQRMALWSAVAKVQVPKLVEEAIQGCARVLGARHYLRAEHAGGIFQKILRDHAAVPLFDGSTAVNLSIVAAHGPAMAARRRRAGAAHRPGSRRPDPTSRGDATTSEFPSLEAMRLTADPCDPTIEALAVTQREIGDSAAIHREALVERLGWVRRRLDLLDRRFLGMRGSARFDPLGEAAARAAQELCLLFSAAACAVEWAARNRAGSYDPEGTHLLACLDQILGRDGDVAIEAVAETMLERHAAESSFSVDPFPLGSKNPRVPADTDASSTIRRPHFEKV